MVNAISRLCAKYRTISSVPAVQHPRQFRRVSPSPSLRLVNNTKCSRQTNAAPHFTIDAVRFIAIRKVALSNEYCFSPSFLPLSEPEPEFLPSSFTSGLRRGGIVGHWDIGKKERRDHLHSTIRIIARVRHARCNSIYRRDLEILLSNRLSVHAGHDNLVAIPFTISLTIFPFVRISFNGM